MGYLKQLNAEYAILQGTYSAMWLSAESARQLHDYYKPFIPNLPPPEEFHVTTVYSRVPMDIPEHNLVITLDPIFYDYKEFPTGEDGSILVMTVQHPMLVTVHKEAIDLGATWDHDEYVPHITLSPDINMDNSWKDNLPPVPKFPLILDTYKVEDLKD